jgi:type II secretory ATPase GspE/PulE/Tfp pilus assembly ATPase PilB-like protein
MISEKSRMDVFESIAREQGFETLQASAIKLWASGVTSLEEVTRVVFFDEVAKASILKAA